MKNVLSYLIILTALVGFQQCSVSTAHVTDVKLCTELNGSLCTENMETFDSSAATFYVSCVLRNAPENTEVAFLWYQLGSERFLIDEVTVSSEDKGSTVDLHSNLTRTNEAWPIGDYEVEIQVKTDNAKAVVRGFRVE